MRAWVRRKSPSATDFPFVVVVIPVALECRVSKHSLSFPISKMATTKPYMVL